MKGTKKAKPKRILSMLLALVMMLGMLPAISLPASAATISDLEFTIPYPTGTAVPSYEAECNNATVEYNVSWFKGRDGDGGLMKEDDEFKAGETYHLRLYFEVPSGTTIQNNQAKLNGYNVQVVRMSANLYLITENYIAREDKYANLPDGVTEWITPDHSTDRRAYVDLTVWMSYYSSVYAIRLEDDIDLTIDRKDDGTIFVNGTKYLDLNGHDMVIHRNTKDCFAKDTLFEISRNAHMIVIDSKGGGELRYDGWIGVEQSDTDQRDVFEVDGKLTVNGGSIMGGGRSKRQYLTNASGEGHDGPTFNGYARNQISGNGVRLLGENAELVVNGGYISGRGLWYYAAVNVESFNTKITINDGYLKGLGCAHVFTYRGAGSLNDKYQDTCDLTINAGIFETAKVDRLVGRRGSSGWMHQYYLYGRYGDVGIADGVLDPQKQRVAIGDELLDPDEDPNNIDTDSTSKRIQVLPYEEMSNRGSVACGDGVTGVLKQGTYYCRWKPGEEGELVANFTAGTYFPMGILDKDCMNQTKQTKKFSYIWTASLNGTPVATATSDTPNIKLSEFNVVDSTTTYTWQTGKNYQINCIVPEFWDGCHVKVDVNGGSGFQTDYTERYDIAHDLGYLYLETTSIDYDLVSGHKQLDYAVSSYAHTNADGIRHSNYTATLNPATRNVLNQWKNEGLIDGWVVTATYDTYHANGAYETTQRKSIASSSSSTSTIDVIGTKEGFLPVSVEVLVMYANYNSETILTTTEDVFITRSTKVQQGKYKRTNDPLVVRYDPSVEYIGDYVMLSSGLYDIIRRGANKSSDGKITVTAANVSWEVSLWNAQAKKYNSWIEANDSIPGISFEGEYLCTRAPGQYRACFTINGTKYYSAAPMTVESNVDFDTYPLSVSTDKLETLYNQNEGIKLLFDPFDPDVTPAWSNNLRVFVQCISRPEGVKTSNTTVYDGTVNKDNLYIYPAARINQSTFRPGEYRFRVTVSDNDTFEQLGDISYDVRRSVEFTVVYGYQATAADILLNGENLTGGSGTGSYLLPAETKYLQFRGGFYPDYSTGPAVSYEWSITGTNNDIAAISSTGRFEAKKPGICTVTMKAYEMVNSGSGFKKVYRYTSTCDVTIPIAGFTVEKPTLTYGALVGNVKPKITAVWSYDGERQTSNTSRWLTAEVGYVKKVGVYGSVTNIEYNTTYEFKYYYKPTAGNQFVLAYGQEEYYDENQTVDLRYVSCNTFDTTAVGSEPGRGYSYGNHWGGDYWEERTGSTPADAYLIYTYQFERLNEPGASYIDTVALILKEPAAYETAVQGGCDAWGNHMKFLTGRISTLSSVVDADGNPVLDYTSNAYYFETTHSAYNPPVGSGKPYDDASGEKAGSNYNWNLNAAFWQQYQMMTPEQRAAWDEIGLTFGPEKEQFYAPGLYYNNLNVKIQADAADGTRYYFSPDVKVFVNGNLVACTVGTGADSLTAKYYFEVGDVPSYESATIKGIEAPVAGMIPTDAADTTCVDDGGNELPIYVGRLTWFVDANNNNKCDEGEEATVILDEDGNCDPSSHLRKDGSFKPNTAYKVQTELVLAPEATMRFAGGVFETRIDGAAATKVMSGYNGFSPIATYQFDPTGEVKGVTVSGTATSFNSDTDDVIIQLIPDGMSEAAYETIVYGNTASYSIAKVESGTYTMKVMKLNHVTREYTVTVGSEDVTQDVKIHLKGDINGDGKITVMDYMRVNSHAKGVTFLTDYDLKCADVVGTDGKVTIIDAMRINAHAKGTAKLW